MVKAAWARFGILCGLALAVGSSSGCACSDDVEDETSSVDGAAAGAGGTHSNGSAGSAGQVGSAGAAAAAALDVFDVFERARAAMRASPDHLPARADALVEARDPVALFEFVRDEVQTYPAASDGLGNVMSGQRWGTRGTLRGGAGTPREKAELLRELYVRAGFPAEVRRAIADPARIDGQRVLLRGPAARAFQPPLPAAELDTWRLALGHGSEPERTPIDPDAAAATALASSLAALLPGTLTAPFDFALTDMPVVRVEIDGEWRYVNPIAPDAELGDPVSEGEPTPTGSAYATPALRVRLEAARADAPHDRFTLVENSYELADVVGRRIQLGFAPPVAPAALAGMRVTDVETLVPVLSVVGAELGQEDRERLVVVGDLLTLGGDLYATTADGGLSINGEPLPSTTTDPAALARVNRVEARVQASAFPRVKVVVSARDVDGDDVEGLGAGAFTLEEDGVPVSFSLTRLAAPPPRVVLLFDVSTSLPEEFRGAGAVTIGNEIATALYAAFPAARVRVGTVSFGANFVGTTWATTLAEAESQVAGVTSAIGSSEIWEALHDAEAQEPTVIILLSDGDATDVALPEYRGSVANGAPVLSIGVGSVNQAVLDEISALSGGSSVPVTAQQAAIDAALAEIDARSHDDYVLNYQAPSGTRSPRTVSVTINDVSVSAEYAVPSAPVTPRALSGLYLTVSVGGQEQTLAVAGFDAGYSTAFPTITSAMLEDVRALLLGRISIAVEAAAPPPSVVLDDWLGEKLSLRPLWEAAVAGDDAAVLAAMEQGFSVAPPKLPLAQPPLPGAWTFESLTFETGPRLATFIQKAKPSGPVTRHLSLFARSQWATAAEDPRAAWLRTLEATAGLAVVEAGLLDGTSTLESLEDAALTLVPAGSADAQAGLDAPARLRWAALEDPFSAGYQLLVPLEPGPFWAVHEASGTVLGMLPDGTGGGAEDVCANYDMASAYLQYLGLLGNLFGVSLGGWTAIGQWEVKNLTMATLVIGYGAQAQDISNPAVDVGCGILNDRIGDAVPAYGAYDALAGTLDTIGVDSGLPSLCGGGFDVCQ